MSPDRITAAMTALCLLAPIARAEVDAPKPPTQTLAQAAPPKSDLCIAVDADLIPPPKDAAPAELGDTASRIATVYGRKIGGFGDVDAIAPPTVMVIDIPPETPNIYDGMPPKQIMKLLAATYSADQWKAFLSEDGVGYESLTRDDSEASVRGALPRGKAGDNTFRRRHARRATDHDRRRPAAQVAPASCIQDRHRAPGPGQSRLGSLRQRFPAAGQAHALLHDELAQHRCR